MATKHGSGETGKSEPENGDKPAIRDEDLERRRRQLDATLASRRRSGSEGERDAKSGGATGYGQAVKLSSEFIAGVLVGAGLGWMLDRLIGTSPWGMIIFLLLGFGAGVLNVMRSAGVVAQPGPDARDKRSKGSDD